MMHFIGERLLKAVPPMAAFHRDRQKFHQRMASFLRRHSGSGRWVRAPKVLTVQEPESSGMSVRPRDHWFSSSGAEQLEEQAKLHDNAAETHAVAMDAHLIGHPKADEVTSHAKEATERAVSEGGLHDQGWRARMALADHEYLINGKPTSSVRSIHKAVEGEPGEFRGGDPEEIRLKKEEKQAEMGEMGDGGEQDEGEEPDPADVEEAQQEEEEKQAEKGLGILSQPLAGMQVSPWPPNTTDYPSKDRNGFSVGSSEFHYFRGYKQPWVEVGPPRQGPNQKKPWSEVLGLPPAMAPSGPPYWRQKLREDRREELGLAPRPNPYAVQPVSKAFDDLLKAARLSWKSAQAKAGKPSLPHYHKPLESRLEMNDLSSMPEHVDHHVRSVLGHDWRNDLQRYSSEVSSGHGEPTDSPIKRATDSWINGSHRFSFIRGVGQAVLTHDKEALSHLSKIRHDESTKGEHAAGVAAGILSRLPLDHQTVESHAGGPVTHLYRESYYVPKGVKEGDHFHLAAPTSFSSNPHLSQESDARSIMRMKLPSHGFSLGHQSGTMNEVLVSGHFKVSKVSRTPDGKIVYHVEEHNPISKGIEDSPAHHEMERFTSEESSPKRRKGLVPCPYGGGIECMRHGGDGAVNHRPSYHHEHEDQPLSHEDLLHQEAEKSSGERTHALGSEEQRALVGHTLGSYESADLDNPDTRSKYMKTLRHVHRYLGTSKESNDWRRKAVSEWHRVADQYHAPEDRPEGHVAMGAARSQIKVTAKVGYQTVDSKDSDVPERLLETAFGKKIGIKDFEQMYHVDHPDYTANLHAIHVNDLGHDRYEVVVMGAIDHHHEAGSEQAASFVRGFRCMAGAGKKGKGQISVHHDKLFMDAKHQGSGIGTEFLRNSVSEYPKWGVTEITTDPHWVGKYTWAKMGFGWKSEDTPDEVRGFLPEFLMSHYGMNERQAAILAGRVADSPTKLACLKLKSPRLTEEGEKLFQHFEQGEYRCRPEEIGKAFLLSDFGDQVWMGGGRVDMSKPSSPSYRQLRKYLGLK